MFNSLAQYFLGTQSATPSSADNTLDPKEAETNQQQQQPSADSTNSHLTNTLQAIPIGTTTSKRGKRRNRNKNKSKNLCDSILNVTARVCEDEDEWLLVECTQQTNKKNGIITLHDLDEDITCLPEDSEDLEPPLPRIEIKHNPLNLNQQQLKRLHQQNSVLISCDDIKDDEEFFRGTTPEKQVITINPSSSAVQNGNNPEVEVVVPSVVQVQATQEAQLDLVMVDAQGQPKATKMEESWFVTPPSCFTSQGPIHMETSPLENLLIEHPSMSVYHDAPNNNAENIDEDLVVLDYNVEHQTNVPQSPSVERTPTHNERIETATPRMDYICNREAKQGLLFRNAQMNHDKKMRQKLCRNAMTRSNKTTETKSGPKKRSEKQHAKNASRANNNRKC